MGNGPWRSETRDQTAAEPASRALDRVAAGDLHALAALYEDYAAQVYRLAFRITGSEADAQDVVQDLFLGLPEALPSFRGDGSFSAWLRACAARQALKLLRTRRRRQEVGLEPEWLAGSEGPGLDGIALETALQRLPETLRIVVVLRDVEGFSHEDVGKMLGISAAASRMRLMRARKQLRSWLEPRRGRKA
ncbi:MAG: RNA polymerase sigma factor [Gemmatimonadota bacterium]|nr:RNA polymerase sigma factor [Gemmatimonadota bacterium]